LLIPSCSTIRLYVVMPIQLQYPVHVEECVLPKSVENLSLLLLFFAISSMEMRRIMIIEKHRNDYTIKPTYFRHLISIEIIWFVFLLNGEQYILCGCIFSAAFRNLEQLPSIIQEKIPESKSCFEWLLRVESLIHRLRGLHGLHGLL